MYILIWILTGFAAFIALNMVYNKVRSSMWKKKPDSSGKIVESPLGRTYMRSMGVGTPVILIETALASTLFEWDTVQKEFSKHTRAVTYDRPGYGYSSISESGPFPDIPVRIIYHSSEKDIELMKQYKVPEEDAVKIETLWEKLIKDEYANLSKDTEWITAGSSTHSIHLEQPEVVTETILALLDRIKIKKV